MNDQKFSSRFRDSFRGYNKDDVNAYIEQLNMRFIRREAELREQLAALREKEAESTSADQPTSSEEATPELQTMVDKLTMENQQLTTQNTDLLKQISDLNAELEAAKNASPVHDPASEEKSRMYDSMSSQVGNILIVANSNAEKIISEANAEASKIKITAESEAKLIVDSAKAESDRMRDELTNKLSEASNTCITDYLMLIEEAKAKFTSITSTLKNELDGIATKTNASASSLVSDYPTNSLFSSFDSYVIDTAEASSSYTDKPIGSDEASQIYENTENDNEAKNHDQNGGGEGYTSLS